MWRSRALEAAVMVATPVPVEMPLAVALASAYRSLARRLAASASRGSRTMSPACSRRVRRIGSSSRTRPAGCSKSWRPRRRSSPVAARGLGVAAPVRRADGRYAGTLKLPGGPCSAVLSREAAEVEGAAVTVAQAEALGRSIARLHLAHDVPGAGSARTTASQSRHARRCAHRPVNVSSRYRRARRGASTSTSTNSLRSPRSTAAASTRITPIATTAAPPRIVAHRSLRRRRTRGRTQSAPKLLADRDPVAQASSRIAAARDSGRAFRNDG